MDVWKWTTDVLDKYRYSVIAILLSGVAIGGMFSYAGCQSRTPGLMPTSDGSVTKVTRNELERQVVDVRLALERKKAAAEMAVADYNKEVEAINAKVAAAEADLERQDQMKADLLETVSVIGTQAAAGGLNPAGLIPLAIGIFGSLLGIGATGDNMRKDKVIVAKKAEIDTLKVTPVVNPTT